MSHRHTAPGQHEHEFEPAHGLPEPLPEGERVLWQGSPDWRHLARRAFHLRKLSLYFSLILLLRAAEGWRQGEAALSFVKSMSGLSLLAALALATVAFLAWLSARTTVYTLTDRRIVMRMGIVLSLSMNLPYKRIVAADLRRDGDGPADVVLRLTPGDKIAYLHLWPHARPWRLAQPEPMLRSLVDAPHVATLLGQAWSKAHGHAVPAAAALVPAGAPTPRSGQRGQVDGAWATI